MEQSAPAEIPSPGRVVTLSQLVGLIPEEVGETLADHASRAKGPIVEIGSYKGKSTCYLASATVQTVYAVDPWDSAGNINGRFGFAEKTTRQVFDEQTGGYPNIVPMQMFSLDAAKHWGDQPISLLFVDGDHTEKAVFADVRAWLPHMAREHTIILDDLDTPKNPGVRRAADRLVRYLGDYTVEAGRLAVWRT